LERYCVVLTKSKKNAIPSSGYIVTPWDELFWSKLLEGIVFLLGFVRAHYTCNTPIKVSQKSFGLYNISFDTWKNIA
jgi:hypothetical protein